MLMGSGYPNEQRPYKQALPSCTFRQHMKYGGREYTKVFFVKLGCLAADHHHLWSECRQKGCVACPWGSA